MFLTLESQAYIGSKPQRRGDEGVWAFLKYDEPDYLIIPCNEHQTTRGEEPRVSDEIFTSQLRGLEISLESVNNVRTIPVDSRSFSPPPYPFTTLEVSKAHPWDLKMTGME